MAWKFVAALVLVPCLLPLNGAKAQSVLYEDFESNADFEETWSINGEATFVDSWFDGTGLYPTGTDTCSFQMWTNARQPWDPQCWLSMNFQTNALDRNRPLGTSYLEFGLADGISEESESGCPGVRVVPCLSFRINLSIDNQAMILSDSSGEAAWSLDYPRVDDANTDAYRDNWHGIQLRFMERSEDGKSTVELFYDSYVWVVEVPEVHPDSLFVYVQGQSLDIVNTIDNINLRQLRRVLTWEDLSVNDESLSTSLPSIRVAPNAGIGCDFRISYETSMPASHVMPLAATPTWGDREQVYWLVDSHMYDGEIIESSFSLVAPQSASLHNIIFATHGQFNAGQIISGTHWHLAELIWGNGDDVFDWSREAILSAMTNGYTSAPMTSDYGTYMELYGARAIDIVVGLGNDISFPDTEAGAETSEICRLDNSYAPAATIVSDWDGSPPFHLSPGFRDSLINGFTLGPDEVLDFRVFFRPASAGDFETRIPLLNQATSDTMGIVVCSGHANDFPFDVHVTGIDKYGESFASNDTLFIGASTGVVSNADSVLVHFRAGGAPSFLSVSAVQHENDWEFDLPLYFAEGRGVDYYVSAHNNDATRYWGTADEPRRLRSYVRTFEISQSTASEQFELFSIPFTLLEPSTADVFGDDLGDTYRTQWRMFFYDSESGTYMEPVNPEETPFVQGTAFWLITKDERILDLQPSSGFSTPHDESYEISLAPGWNLLGSPFAFAVAWNSTSVDGAPFAEAIEQGLVSTAIGWENQQYHDAGDLDFEPWRGYWIRNIAHPPRFVQLQVPPVESADISKEQYAADVTGRRIAIRAACGHVVNESAYVGVTADARDSWDPADTPAPPLAPGNGLSIYFPHGDWEVRPGIYTCDMREAHTAPGHGSDRTWFFDVAKNFADRGPADEIVLEFDGIESFEGASRIVLLDRKLVTTHDLRSGEPYRFLLGEAEYVLDPLRTRFVLLLGDDNYLETQLGDLSRLPSVTVLHQNIPNPFNPSTVLRYDLARPGTVRLVIYDLRGRLVATVKNGFQEAGHYEVAWHGIDESGKKVHAGVYLARLVTADGQVDTRKLTLIK